MPNLPSRLRVLPIAGIHDLLCPSCKQPTLSVSTDRSTREGDSYFLTDGDTIFGLRARLAEEQKHRCAFDYGLSVGACPYCEARYYVIEAGFIQADVVEDSDEHKALMAVLYRNHSPVKVGPELNFLCEAEPAIAGVPARWLLRESSTDAGPLHRHLFGPFSLDDPESVEGPYGVAACHGDGEGPWQMGQDLLFSAWDALRALNAAGSVERSE